MMSMVAAALMAQPAAPLQLLDLAEVLVLVDSASIILAEIGE